MKIDGVLTEISPAREVKAILKLRRAEIRVKYSVLADQEIANEIPALEKRLNASLEAGEQSVLSIGVEQ